MSLSEPQLAGRETDLEKGRRGRVNCPLRLAIRAIQIAFWLGVSLASSSSFPLRPTSSRRTRRSAPKLTAVSASRMRRSSPFAAAAPPEYIASPDSDFRKIPWLTVIPGGLA
jgi:hypothetical protein